MYKKTTYRGVAYGLLLSISPQYLYLLNAIADKIIHDSAGMKQNSLKGLYATFYRGI